MKDGPVIATVAALLGDPARANMLVALMDGRALTVSELAKVSGIGMSTASEHLAKLKAAQLLTSQRQGRHHYVRLSGPDVAEVLEALMGLAQRTGAVRLRVGPKDAALRQARICYDHLAGEKGVALSASLMRNGWISDDALPVLTSLGRTRLAGVGLDMDRLTQGRRPVCRRCLDWSERQSHLGGALGAALLALVINHKWAQRLEGRVVAFTPTGARAFASAFDLPPQ